MRFAGFHERTEFVQELVGAELVGIVSIEIWEEWVEMIAQEGLGRLHTTEQRYGPRPRTMAAAGITNIRRKRAALFHISSRTFRFLTRGSSLLRTRRLDLLIAPLSVYELSVVAEADVIASKVVPQKA